MKIDAQAVHPGFEEIKVLPQQLQSLKKVKPEKKPPSDEHAYSKQEIEQVIGQLNRATEAFNVSFRFVMHEGAERYMFQVVDIQRNEVIKEIPPKKLLDLAANIKEMIGLMLDEKK